MRILAIGNFLKQEFVDVAPFRSAASFLDYDAVVIDFSGIWREYDTILSETYRGQSYLGDFDSAALKSDLSVRRPEIEEMLRLGRTLVVFTSSPQIIRVDTGERRVSQIGRMLEASPILADVDLLCILPVVVRTAPSSGANIEFRGHEPFASFWATNQRRMGYSAYFTETVGTPLWFVRGTNRLVGSYLPWESGHIVFSPAYTGDPEDEAEQLEFFESISVLVSELSKGAGGFMLPKWCMNYKLPDEDSLRSRLENSEIELEKLMATMEKQAKAVTELEEYKILISGTGRALEVQVGRVLNELGFEVAEGPPGRDDLVLKHNDRVAVVEVKGVSKSAAEKHAAQLEKWVNDYSLSTGKVPKGILVVNAHKDTPLSDRTEAPFPHQMIAYSENRGHCLLTSTQLLCICLHCRRNPDQKASIIERLLTTTGRFDDFSDWENHITYEGETPDAE